MGFDIKALKRGFGEDGVLRESNEEFWTKNSRNTHKIAYLGISQVAHESLTSWPLEKCPDQLFHGYFMSFWSKTSHMTLL